MTQLIRDHRRIFEEKKYCISDNVVSYERFKPYIDKTEILINKELYPAAINRAEAILGTEYPQLIASDFMMFKRNGNRSVFQNKYFPRRDHLLTFALAEHIERKGRFTDSLVDLLWLILEETTWVLPAHNPSKEGVNCCLPYAYAGEVDYIDLFSATTGATLALVYYLCKDILDEISELLCERLLFELERRIVKPYLDPVALSKKMTQWTGVNGNKVNNWNPWIISNVLTVCAFTVKDQATREAIVRNSMPMLDNFISVYKSDGGCDEGPSYWGAAGAALFDACHLLYDLTDGYVNIFEDDLIRKMGEYVVKAVINNDRVLNFADSPAKVKPDPYLLYQWGTLSKSDMMKSFALSRIEQKLPAPVINSSHPYRTFKNLVEHGYEKGEFTAPVKFWLDGIVIAGTRESSATDKGLYLAFKGGHNAESHNHNDVGSIVVFADGKPIFLDAGSGTYTRRTFSDERYTIWAMCSDYHNVATFNGITQENGEQAHSCDHVYEEETGKLTMNLKYAYPEKAGLSAYTRSAVLEDGMITVTDRVAFEKEGSVMFSFLCDEVPSDVTADNFVLHGRTISFDASLEYACEPLDKTWPEVENIPERWDVDVLYRVTLKSKVPVIEKTYVLTVK